MVLLQTWVGVGKTWNSLSSMSGLKSAINLVLIDFAAEPETCATVRYSSQDNIQRSDFDL